MQSHQLGERSRCDGLVGLLLKQNPARQLVKEYGRRRFGDEIRRPGVEKQKKQGSEEKETEAVVAGHGGQTRPTVGGGSRQTGGPML